MMALIPMPYRWLLLLVLSAALVGFGFVRGIDHEQTKQQVAQTARIKAQDAAILARVADNAALAIKQAANNAAITKAKDEELDTVRAALARAGRLRVGPALCSGTPAPAEASSAGGSLDADPARRLVPDGIARDIVTLELQVEEAFATGRACQAFLKSNGLTP